MLPCRHFIRVDVGKEVYYALDEGERKWHSEIASKSEKKRGKVSGHPVQRASAKWIRSSCVKRPMHRDTRRLVQLTISARDKTDQLMDMLLAKKRAKDRRSWLETKGNLAEV